MRGHFIKTLGMLALVACVSHPSLAQERSNPFVKPPTAAEEQARLDERTRNIIREMQPEIKAGIMQDVKAADASLEINLRRRVDALAEARPMPSSTAISGDAPISTKKPDENAAPVKVPEGAEFISCVNGKALYRDKDKTLFQVQGDGVKGSDRCAK